jgi:hypothetical protein
MEREEFEAALRDSPHLRQSLAELLRSTEQAVTLIALAAARQLDAARFEADLLRLLSEAAADGSDPARDHILNHVRLRLRVQQQAE